MQEYPNGEVLSETSLTSTPCWQGSSGTPVVQQATRAASSADPPTPAARRFASPRKVYTRRRILAARGSAPTPPPTATLSPSSRGLFLRWVMKAVGTLLPVPKIDKQRKKNPPPGSPPRRSRRIAGLGAEPSPPAQSRVKKMIMCTALGMEDHQDVLWQQQLQEYAKLFRQPLPDSHICALAALFGWVVPEQEAGGSCMAALSFGRSGHCSI
jgi:hypothetical protein